MNMIHLDTTGSYELPKMEEVVGLLRSTIDNFDNKLSSVKYDSSNEVK